MPSPKKSKNYSKILKLILHNVIIFLRTRVRFMLGGDFNVVEIYFEDKTQ